MPRLMLCVVLGLVTTIFIVVSLSLWISIKAAPARVASDGDHLNPWLISLSRPGARRVIWFEKGRIWNHQQVGPRNGTGSSAAVNCWSFATSTRNDPRTTHGPIDIPSEITDATQCSPQEAWGGCVDYRGWPMAAASSCALGLMSQNATAAYRIDRGVPLAQDTTLGSRNSLADLEMVPWRPVWSGLIVDVAFYGSLWWCVLLAHRTVAARRRLRKGACPACGYDMTGLEARVCPECGASAST
jgi:hypothetical protein